MAFSHCTNEILNEDSPVAVLYGRPQNSPGHCGFAYLTDESEPVFLHLAFHHRLMHDTVPVDNYVWELLGLDRDNARVLASFLSDVAVSDSEIPYSTNREKVAFDPTNGNLIPPPLGSGLTCASFIYIIMRDLGFSILKEETWQPRDSDDTWAAEILAMLKRYASEEHVIAAEEAGTSNRLRPEEVCACAALDPSFWPTEYVDAAKAATLVTSTYDELCPTD